MVGISKFIFYRFLYNDVVTCTYKCMRMYVCVCVCVCVCVLCMHVCVVYACVYCVCVCAHEYMYVHVYVHVNTIGNYLIEHTQCNTYWTMYLDHD